MSVNDSFDFEQAENIVLDQTGPTIVEQSSGFSLVGFTNPIQNVISRVMENPDEAAALHHQVHAYSDLYNRGIIDFQEDSLGDNETNQQLYDALNEIDSKAGEIKYSEGIMLSLAFMAFSGVLMRPKDLLLREQNRKLHSSDVISGRGESHLSEVYRHRRNLLFSIATQQVVRERDKKHLQPFVIGDRITINNETVMDRLPNLDPVKDRVTVELVNSIYVASYASRLLQLFGADNDAGEELRARFIERGFGIFSKLDAEHRTGEDLFYADLSPEQERHILMGDRTGGGHHLSSLDSRYKKVVSEVVEVPSSLQPNVSIPVAMTRRVVDGVAQEPVLDSFFPSEWSAEKVIRSVKHPARVVFEREQKGRLTQYVHCGGLLIQRIIALYEDCDREEIITAFPKADVPSELKRRLSLAA